MILQHEKELRKGLSRRSITTMQSMVKILGTEIFNHENIRNEPSLEKAWFPIIYNNNDNKFKQILSILKNEFYKATTGNSKSELSWNLNQ